MARRHSAVISRPSRILVAIDGSDYSMKAGERAVTIASSNKAKLIAVNVIDLSTIFSLLPNETKRQLTRIGRAEAVRMFEDIVKLARQHKVSIETKIIQSRRTAAEEILKYAKENDVDLIVIGTRGRSGLKKVLLGSVASKVVTAADCSVLVVR